MAERVSAPAAGGTPAVAGGAPVRTAPFPSVGDLSGRRLGAEELAACERVLASGRLNSTVGPETRQLEAEFGAAYGIEHVVASSSGTAALHLAVAAVDPEPGDEIITTPISDAGTVVPILFQNAVPVFADVDPATGMLDVDSVRAAITSRTRAIIAVHLFGAPAPVVELRALADEHGLVLIEDCAQAYLTRCAPAGALAGTIGHIGCFSLQQSKHMTAGDGGLTVTGDAALANRMRLFGDKGWPRQGDDRSHQFLGANYRLTELSAAVARAQLPKLPGVVESRRRAAARLSAVVAELPGIAAAPSGDSCSYWLYPLVVGAGAGTDAPAYAAALRAEGIPARAGYLDRPLYLNTLFTERRTYGRSAFPFTAPPARVEHTYGPGMCPVAESLIEKTLIVVAWNEQYTDADVDDIGAALRKVSGHFAGGAA